VKFFKMRRRINHILKPFQVRLRLPLVLFDDVIIVNRKGMVMKPDKQPFPLYVFVLFFWPWPCSKHNSCSHLTEELSNRNVLVSERKTKDCARSWTFQHKPCHLCLLLWCLKGFITISLLKLWCCLWNTPLVNISMEHHVCFSWTLTGF